MMPDADDCPTCGGLGPKVLRYPTETWRIMAGQWQPQDHGPPAVPEPCPDCGAPAVLVAFGTPARELARN